MRSPVDLVVNVFERTYRKVLSLGFFPEIEADNRQAFAGKIALINNVTDRKDAADRAEDLLRAGELDAYYFVDEGLDRALSVVGLSRRDLGRIPHYTDWALVAVTLSGNPYLLHWDADVRLRQPVDWVGPSIDLMESDKRILVANPNWRQPTLELETLWKLGDFAIGYGFSDQLFLVRRCDLAQPIYGCRCLASLRYPLAHIAPIFEKRVDAYMRTHGRLRATYTKAVYEHPEHGEGATHPTAGLTERVRLARNRYIVKALRSLPTTNPCWKI